MQPLSLSPSGAEAARTRGDFAVAVCEPLAEGCVFSVSLVLGACCGGLGAQSCLTLATPWAVACHGISRARLLEGVTVSFPRGSSGSSDQTRVSCRWSPALQEYSLPTEPPGHLLTLGKGLCDHDYGHDYGG